MQDFKKLINYINDLISRSIYPIEKQVQANSKGDSGNCQFLE